MSVLEQNLSPLVPRWRTVESYTVDRLGTAKLRTRFTHTVPQLDSTTAAVTAHGVVTNDQIDTLTVPGLTDATPGREVFSGATYLGTITAVDGDDLTVTPALDPALVPIGTVVALQSLNAFGQEVCVRAPVGLSYETTLAATTVATTARLQLALGRIHVTAVATVLAAMGQTPDIAAIGAAIDALAAQGVSLDTMIVSELELLEEERRASEIAMTVLGDDGTTNTPTT